MTTEADELIEKAWREHTDQLTDHVGVSLAGMAYIRQMLTHCGELAEGLTGAKQPQVVGQMLDAVRSIAILELIMANGVGAAEPAKAAREYLEVALDLTPSQIEELTKMAIKDFDKMRRRVRR
jgi:hypothetical protein